jgi:D-sedoheptulose 7-phosphate isomerase
MSLNMKEYVLNEITDRIELKKRVLSDSSLIDSVIETSTLCIEALNNGRKIMLAGNGGSAGDSQHIAGELVNRFHYDRDGLAAVALTTDTSVITAIANDYDYNKIFSRQIESIGKPGDIFFGITTSGNSGNILEAAKAAKKIGIKVIGLTGKSGGQLREYCDTLVAVPAEGTPEIQEIHLFVAHTVCAIIESEIFPRT